MNGKLLLEHTAKWKVLYIAVLLASLSFLGVKAFDTYSPTVMSDKDDYAPGEVAIITGYGWTQDQYVDVHFEETPAYHEEHLHDYHDVAVDADGKWMIKYQIEERHLGVAFDVRVVGKQSGAEAFTHFTDGSADFRASGLPTNTSVTVALDYEAAQGTALTSTTFLSQNVSSSIAAKNGSGLINFKYPLLLTGSDKKIYRVTAVNKGASPLVYTVSEPNNFVESSIESGGEKAVSNISATYKRTTAVTASSVEGQQGGTVILSANLKESGANLSGKTIRFTFNGVNYTSPATNNGGNTTVTANIGNLVVGSYTYTAAFLEDSEYAGGTATGTVTVTPACTAASISTQPVASTITYGANAVFTVVAEGTAPFNYQWQVDSGNGFGDISGTTSATLTLTNPSVSRSGNQYRCVVTNSCGTATSNAATLTVTKAAATVSLVASSLSQTYSGFPLSVSATTVPADLAINYTYHASSIAPTAADSYTVVGTVNDANYEGSAEGTFVIAKKALAVTANSKTREYNVANPTLDGELSGAVAADGIRITYATTATQSSSVGDYPITATLEDPNNKLANYTVTNTAGNLKITPAQATITVADLAKTYNGSAQGATVTTLPAGLDVTVTYKGSATVPTAADTYTVVATLNNSNYSAANATGMLVIAPQEVTATLANAGKVYDGTTAATGTTAILKGVISPDDVSTTVAEEVYSAADAGVRTVSATVTLAGTDKDNYTLTSVTPATATISPKALTASIAAEDKVYDGNSSAAAVGSVTDVVGTDVVTVTVTGPAFNDKRVGTGKSVTAGVSINNPNYSLTSTTASTTANITPKAMTIAVSVADKVYDGLTSAAVQATITDGLVTDDQVIANASDGAFDTKNVGTDKDVTASISISGNDAENYTFNNSASTKAAITPRAITVAADAKSKVYGDSDPTFTYSVTVGELVTAENFSGNLNRVAGNNVGTYAIQQNTLTAGDNYRITYASANLTITPKAITVTAVAKMKMLGQPDPALTYTVSPALVGTDDFTGSLTRNPGEEAGTYAIEQGALTAGNNYNLTYVGADLTVHAIPTVVIENPAPVQYSTIVNVIANYTGIVNNPVWVWGFTANTSGVQSATSITGSATVPSTPGVHKLVLQYKNAVGDVLTTEPVFISVYDPEGGFITGGGWINSPMGALADSDAIGKANFGFVAKYKKGKNEVEGNTEFQFQAGGINFKSSAHNAGSLVISGAKATYKGTGTIAGLSGTYEFMVVATDGQVTGGGGNDKFRIKIWNGGHVVYDNARGTDENADLGDLTILGGGSIVIHENKAVATSPKTSKVISEELEEISTARFDNYPNAFSDRTTIRFSLDTEQNYALEVYDIRGALVKKVGTGTAEAGKVYEYELDSRNLAEGVYFARLATGSGIQTIKMLLKK